MKSIVVVLVVAFVASVVPSSIVAADPSETQWTQLATLPVGTAPGEIGYLMHIEGASARGPQALAATPNGDLYILDSVNRRVLTISHSGSRRTIDVPSSRYPREILVTQRAMYLLDDDNRILELDFDGALLRAIALPSGMPTHEVFRLVEAPGGAVKVWAGGYQDFELDGLPQQVDLEAPLLAKGHTRGVLSPGRQRWRGEMSGPISGRLVVDQRNDQRTGETNDERNDERTIDLATYGTFGSARIIGFDRRGQAYVLFEDLYDGGGRIGVELSIRRYNGDGLMTGAARVPFERFAIAPRRTAEVAPDGTVYVMVPGATAVSIYRLDLGLDYHSLIPARPAPRSSGVGSRSPRPLTWGTSLTRGQVMDRANQIQTTGWYWHNTYDTKADGTPRNLTAATKPEQLGTVDGQYFQGVPYLWGGFDTPYSRSDWGTDLWSNWDGALSRYYPGNGPLVGNISRTVVYGTAGVDCAGFVYAALGDTANPKKGTTSLQVEGLPADAPQAGQPGNYFANPDHTFFYYFRRLDGQGMETLEATTDGNPDAAKRFSRSFSEAAFYDHRSWWSYGPGEGPFQAYTVWNNASSCLFGMNTWYKFTVTGGTNVTVSNIVGGDVDLYVYSQSNYAYVGRSTNGGTLNEYVPINPGSYYAVVHQWQSGVCVSWSMWW